jgi:hypothetical protein
MNTNDVRTEMRKLADSKPVHAAAGVGVLATETLRELPARLAKWRDEATVTSLSTRATEYVTTARARAVGEYDKARARAMGEYDKLAKRGQRALSGPATSHGKGELNGKAGQHKTSQHRTARPKATHRIA